MSDKHTADFCFNIDCEKKVITSGGGSKTKSFEAGKNYGVDFIVENAEGTIDIFFSDGNVLQSVNTSGMGTFLGVPSTKDSAPAVEEVDTAQDAVEDSTEGETAEEQKKKWF